MNPKKEDFPGKTKSNVHIFEQDGLYFAFALKGSTVTFSRFPRRDLKALSTSLENAGYSISISEEQILREPRMDTEDSQNPTDLFLIRVGQALLNVFLGGDWDPEINFAYPVDLPKFTKRVLEETRKIPKGSVATYGEIAELAGSPGGARAVGNAMNKNPLGVIVPCHRVIKSNGRVGFSLVWEMLEREGVKFRRGRVVRGTHTK